MEASLTGRLILIAEDEPLLPLDNPAQAKLGGIVSGAPSARVTNIGCVNLTNFGCSRHGKWMPGASRILIEQWRAERGSENFPVAVAGSAQRGVAAMRRLLRSLRFAQGFRTRSARIFGRHVMDIGRRLGVLRQTAPSATDDRRARKTVPDQPETTAAMA